MLHSSSERRGKTWKQQLCRHQSEWRKREDEQVLQAWSRDPSAGCGDCGETACAPADHGGSHQSKSPHCNPWRSPWCSRWIRPEGHCSPWSAHGEAPKLPLTPSNQISLWEFDNKKLKVFDDSTRSQKVRKMQYTGELLQVFVSEMFFFKAMCSQLNLYSKGVLYWAPKQLQLKPLCYLFFLFLICTVFVQSFRPGLSSNIKHST